MIINFCKCYVFGIICGNVECLLGFLSCGVFEFVVWLYVYCDSGIRLRVVDVLSFEFGVL